MKLALTIQLVLASVLILAIFCIRRGLLKHTYVWTLSGSAWITIAFVSSRVDEISAWWAVTLTIGYVLMNISLMIHLSELSKKRNHVRAAVDPLDDLCRSMSTSSLPMVPEAHRTTAAESS